MPETQSVKTEAKVLDTRGLLCPYPYIQARQALEALPPGSRLEILTDSEPTAMSSVPILCEQNGYTFTREKDRDTWRLVVTKGSSRED